MKVFTEWLNDYLEEPLSVEEIADAFDRAGVEVEGVQKSPTFDDSIVVARVEKLQPHSNADNLKLAVVNDGEASYQVVCGAPNVAEGQLVPLVKTGSQLPDGTEVAQATIRGEESHGMIASAEELSLGKNHQGILVLDAKTTIGLPLSQALSGWAILDITVAANRVDLQSMLGLAREVAVHAGVEMTLDRKRLLKQVEQLEFNSEHQARFENQAPDHFLEYLLVDIDVGNAGGVTTPAWMQNRLRQNGVRPLHPIVDITNFVMLELGQPVHAFDKTKVQLPIQLRFANSDEKITTIDQVEHVLTGQDLVIADQEQAIALAGVMGGAGSEVSQQTSSILLESAVFKGVDVRKTAIRHGMRTEASARFERSLPLVYPYAALARAVELYQQIFEVETIGIYGKPVAEVYQPREKIKITTQRFTELAGIDVENQVVEKGLPRLGFSVDSTDEPGVYKIQPPYWRPDVTLEEDVFEETIKIVGLDKLPATIPDWHITDIPQTNHHWHLRDTIRNSLVGLGLFEVTTYPFLSKKQLELLSLDSEYLRVQNPRSEEQAYLRRSLLGGLSSALASNTRRQDSFGLFEMGQVFHPQANEQPLPDEPLRLGVIFQGSDPYWQVKNVLDNLCRRANIDVHFSRESRPYLHPNRQADVLAGTGIGYLGELHPEIVEQMKLVNRAAYLEFDLDFLIEHWQPTSVTHTSDYEAVNRDLTLLAGEGALWQDIARVLATFDNLDFVYSDSYVDSEKYEQDQRAITVHLRLFDPEKTLTSQQAEDRLQKITKALTDELDVTLPE